MPDEQLRLFAALPLPPDAQPHLERIASILRPRISAALQPSSPASPRSSAPEEPPAGHAPNSHPSRRNSPAQSPRDARWINPRDAHITLRFIGDWPAHDAPRLGSVIAEASASHAPIQLSLGKTGFFPARGSPRVLWIGVDGALTQLARLRDDIERALAGVGCDPETQPFSPHITIARIPAALPPRAAAPLRRAIEATNAPPSQPPPSGKSARDSSPFTIDRVALYRSSLAPSGPAYTPLRTIPLS